MGGKCDTAELGRPIDLKKQLVPEHVKHDSGMQCSAAGHDLLFQPLVHCISVPDVGTKV